MAGVVGGSIATRRVEPRLIALAFAGLSGALALYLLLRRPHGGEGEKGEVPRSRLPILAPLGGLVGFASGFLGIGGGALMVPGLAALGLDIRGSVATSLLAMVPITLAGAMAHGQLGNLSLPHAGVLALGAILGGQIGPRLAERVPRKRLEQGLALVLLYAAARMAL